MRSCTGLALAILFAGCARIPPGSLDAAAVQVIRNPVPDYFYIITTEYYFRSQAAAERAARAFDRQRWPSAAEPCEEREYWCVSVRSARTHADQIEDFLDHADALAGQLGGRRNDLDLAEIE